MTEEDQDSSAKESEAPAPSSADSSKSEDGGEPVEPSAAKPEESPKKSKKGKRKKRSSETREITRRPELDAQGRERPAFLLEFPNEPELERLIAAFEAGNYAHVRKAAPALVEHSADPEVKAAARELLARIDPDPLVKFLLAVAIGLFVLVVLFTYHFHG
jgi:hypothetical protein